MKQNESKQEILQCVSFYKNGDNSIRRFRPRLLTFFVGFIVSTFVVRSISG